MTFKRNRPLQVMILWLLLCWVLAAINPLYPSDWLLENVLVFVSVGVLAVTWRRFPWEYRAS